MTTPTDSKAAYEDGWHDGFLTGYQNGRTRGLADVRDIVDNRTWLRILHAVRAEADGALIVELDALFGYEQDEAAG